MRNIFQLLLRIAILVFAGEALSEPLKQYQWKSRILLLNVSSMESASEQEKLFRKSNHENKDRDLILLKVDKGHKSLWSKYKFQNEVFRLVLIGKDGGVKREYSNVTPMKEIYQVIDAMPMRQQEMKESQKAKN